MEGGGGGGKYSTRGWRGPMCGVIVPNVKAVLVPTIAAVSAAAPDGWGGLI